MQRRNYNPNRQNNSNNSNSNQNRRLTKFRNGSGGKPRPAMNQSIPGEQRDVSVNPKYRKRNADYPPNIEPGDPSTYYEVSGILEMHPNGYGFLRDPNNDYTRIITDPFVPGSMIERYGFREGVPLTALVQPGTKTQGPRVRDAISVAGMDPDDYINVIPFDDRTPINPEEWLRLETGPLPLTTRVMDILTPLGKGQRSLIVAPPRSGKTILLHHISQAVLKNHPDVKVIILLVDERPEEVTEFRREVPGAEVVASSLDREIESHVRLSQLVLERCRRLAEAGQDVFLLLDSITRLARAFNKWVGNTGRTMSGGVDVKAMDIPKKLFATARAFEGGGSLTIVGTALIETGSRMDDLIFQEFKGTGNMELVLDKRLAEQRIYPAMDIGMSGTRREEKLFPAEILRGATLIRRTLSTRSPVDAMETLTSKLEKFNSNAEFFYQFLKGQKQID
ncbi:MAG: transcription termination factor Rho [Planctomycetaceae bacterium]|jgi:transcription termination factor Rho|nr:transcription termination factor Rho [Planctomycetaceae bacterium]